MRDIISRHVPGGESVDTCDHGLSKKLVDGNISKLGWKVKVFIELYMQKPYLQYWTAPAGLLCAFVLVDCLDAEKIGSETSHHPNVPYARKIADPAKVSLEEKK